MEIELNKAEQRLAKYLAKARYQKNRSTNTENQKIGPQSNEETDLNGIGAEIAFCKYFNLYPDLSTEHRPKEDVVMHDGISVDTKTTKYNNGHLLAPIWKKKISTDFYALLVGDFPTYRFAGFISGKELFSDKNIKDFGYGDTYGVKQEELSPTL